ncbi:MAG: hypothetical protein J5666_03865 [Bacilli bacterium]|nr:hypothetical protein [Bacilli bacterium]
MMSLVVGPRDKVLSEDEETVEVVEVIENYYDYSDLDSNDDVVVLDDLMD